MGVLLSLDEEKDEGLVQKLRAYEIMKEPELAVEVCEELLDKMPDDERINDRMVFQSSLLREDER